MNWNQWIRSNYERIVRVTRGIGYRNYVATYEMEDYVSRVIVRLLVTTPRASDGERWGLVQTVAKRQAVDDIRRRTHKPDIIALDVWHGEKALPDAYAEIEVLDQVRRLGAREGKAVLGKALGFYDAELAEDGVTRDAVSKRRERARERLAA